MYQKLCFQEQHTILLERLFYKVDFSVLRVLVIDPNAINIVI